MAERGYSAKPARLDRAALSPDERKVIAAIRLRPAALRARLERVAEAGPAEQGAWPAVLPAVLARSVALLRELESQGATDSRAWLPALLAEFSPVSRGAARSSP